LSSVTAETKRAQPEAGTETGSRRLDPLLRPRSVVVVGASPNPSFVSGIFKNLLRNGYTGSVAAVNPRYENIYDAPCYPSVLDVPWPIDLAVVGVSWRLVPALLDQCAQKGVGALELITSGFAEAGGDGIERQAQLASWAQRTGTAVGGPNCLGLMHAPNMVKGRKMVYLEAVEAIATGWRHGPAIFLGDTNCGWPDIDEERPVFGPITARWLDALAALGWRDAFRYLRAEERFYTWYSPNAGNGFRLDQAFVNRRMLPRLQDARYEWGRPEGDAACRREALSDHAALLLDFA